METKQKFVNEVRQHVSGVSATPMGRRTKRLGKKLSVLAVLLIAGAICATAAILPFFMQSTMTVHTKAKDVQIRTWVGNDPEGVWTDLPATFTTDVNLNSEGQKIVHFEIKNDESNLEFDVDISGVVITPTDNGLTATILSGEGDPITTLHIPASSTRGFDVLLESSIWVESADYTVTLDIPIPE